MRSSSQIFYIKTLKHTNNMFTKLKTIHENVTFSKLQKSCIFCCIIKISSKEIILLLRLWDHINYSGTTKESVCLNNHATKQGSDMTEKSFSEKSF